MVGALKDVNGVVRFVPGKEKDAATRLQAVARGRTGRRRSVDAARERFGYLKKSSNVVVAADHSEESRSRSRVREGTAASRSRTRPAAPAAVRRPGQRPAPPKPAPPVSKGAVEVTTQVLERVGREAVILDVWGSTRRATDDEVRKACEKARDKGTRWDLNAKIKAREEKIGELRGLVEKLSDERSSFPALAAEVEGLLLRCCSSERERADLAERALVDGTGLRPKLEKLEAERDEARARVSELEVRLAADGGQSGEIAKALDAARRELAAATKERDAASAEARRLAEKVARLQGVDDGSMLVTEKATEAALSDRDEARRELESLRVETVADTERQRAAHAAVEQVAKHAAAEADAARAKLAEALERLAVETARAARAEGMAEAAQKHYAAARAELREKGDDVIREREGREGERRRLSEAQRRDSSERDRREAATAAYEALLAASSRRDAAQTQRLAELERQDAELRDKLQVAEAQLSDALSTRAEGAAANDAVRKELYDLRLKVDKEGASAEARAAELRARAEAADEARERAVESAARAAADASTERAKAEAAYERSVTAATDTEKARAEAAEARRAADTMRVEMAAAKQELAVESRLRNDAQAKEESERRERTAALAQLLALREKSEHEHIDHAREHADLIDEIEALLASADAARRLSIDNLEGANAMAAKSQAEVRALRVELKDASQSKTAALELSKTKGELEALRRRLAAAEATGKQADVDARAKIESLDAELREADAMRRKLHNTIQELRGNIRVFARIRPFLPSDADDDCDGSSEPKKHQASSLDAAADGQSLTLATVPDDDDDDETPFARARGRGPQNFAFDKVFDPAAGQDDVFREVAEFVQSALDGYHVCLFSYGQTGSGKTHTMQGSGRGAMRGIIPRAMEQVAEYLAAQRDRGWTYTMHVTYLEIYNETVRDLLASHSTSLDIRRDPKTGRTAADGATHVPVDPADADQVDDLMTLAAKHRCVAATDMNAQSSRSHAVFTLHLDGTNASKNAKLRGALNLCDLAGSERLNRSRAVGQRAKETAHINKSLSALAGVFNALANKKPHVPYRDSKLTYLLMPALSGQGKTLLFINLSPTQRSATESLSTLRFGHQVRKVELGRAVAHIESL